MAKEWTSIEIDLPPLGISIIASVKDGNNFYSEFLTLDNDNTWSYQNGKRLERTKKVVGWMDGPPTYTG